MTTREWFRVLRGAMWARDPGPREATLAYDIDTIAAAVTRGERPAEWVRVGSLHWIESVESYQERERVLALVREDLDRAMQRLLRETQETPQ